MQLISADSKGKAVKEHGGIPFHELLHWIASAEVFASIVRDHLEAGVRAFIVEQQVTTRSNAFKGANMPFHAKGQGNHEASTLQTLLQYEIHKQGARRLPSPCIINKSGSGGWKTYGELVQLPDFQSTWHVHDICGGHRVAPTPTRLRSKYVSLVEKVLQQLQQGMKLTAADKQTCKKDLTAALTAWMFRYTDIRQQVHQAPPEIANATKSVIFGKMKLDDPGDTLFQVLTALRDKSLAKHCSVD